VLNTSWLYEEHCGCVIRGRNCLPFASSPMLVGCVLLVLLVFCVVFFCFVCLRLVSCVHNVAIISGLFILDCPCVLCTQCCHHLWIVHSWLSLCLVYTMLPLSLDCSFLIAPVSCVPNVAIISGLFILDCPCVLCTQCCHYLWIVHSWLPLCLVYPMLPSSLDCSFLISPVSCVPNVAIISGLFILDCPCVLCTQCCHYLWIVHSWLSLCLVYPMLPSSLDCSFLITPLVFSNVNFQTQICNQSDKYHYTVLWL
jgi:hypothetical protein